ncbi:MAG: hypothetical protein ABF856_16505, partial [Acetobacter aceti]
MMRPVYRFCDRANPFSTVDQVNEILKDNTYIDILGWKDAFSNAKSAVKQVMLLGVWGDAYLATTKAGKEIVIFKGYLGLRDKLTGTRYLRDHPIVKEAGFIIGRKEMIGEALKGTRISIVCLVAWDIVHELLQDKLDMTRLGVTILSDIFQTVLATFVGTAIGIILSSFGIPIIVTFSVGLVVSLGVAWVLARLDSQQGETAKAIDFVKERENFRTINDVIIYLEKKGRYIYFY